MSLDASLLSHCKNVAHTVAPELLGHPLYILDGSTLADLPIAQQHDCLGWAHDGRLVDYALRERIRDDWRGPGPVVALLPDAIQAEWGTEYFRDGVLSTLLHELAHILPPSPDIPQDDFADMFDVPLIREHQAKVWTDAQARPDPSPGSDDFHDWRFIRRCCHLWTRAKRAGWDIPSHGLLGGSLWFVCQLPHWVCCLFREVVEMHAASFSEIESTPPPAEFMAMWDSALQFHFRRERATFQEQDRT